jgi:hypothetical protein
MKKIIVLVIFVFAFNDNSNAQFIQANKVSVGIDFAGLILRTTSEARVEYFLSDRISAGLSGGYQNMKKNSITSVKAEITGYYLGLGPRVLFPKKSNPNFGLYAGADVVYSNYTVEGKISASHYYARHTEVRKYNYDIFGLSLNTGIYNAGKYFKMGLGLKYGIYDQGYFPFLVKRQRMPGLGLQKMKEDIIDNERSFRTNNLSLEFSFAILL